MVTSDELAQKIFGVVESEPITNRDQIQALPEIQHHTMVIWGWLGASALGAIVAARYGYDLNAHFDKEHIKHDGIGAVLSGAVTAFSVGVALWKSADRNERIYQIGKSPKSLDQVAEEFQG